MYVFICVFLLLNDTNWLVVVTRVAEQLELFQLVPVKLLNVSVCVLCKKKVNGLEGKPLFCHISFRYRAKEIVDHKDEGL